MPLQAKAPRNDNNIPDAAVDHVIKYAKQGGFLAVSVCPQGGLHQGSAIMFITAPGVEYHTPGFVLQAQSTGRFDYINCKVSVNKEADLQAATRVDIADFCERIGATSGPFLKRLGGISPQFGQGYFVGMMRETPVCVGGDISPFIWPLARLWQWGSGNSNFFISSQVGSRDETAFRWQLKDALCRFMDAPFEE